MTTTPTAANPGLPRSTRSTPLFPRDGSSNRFSGGKQKVVSATLAGAPPRPPRRTRSLPRSQLAGPHPISGKCSSPKNVPTARTGSSSGSDDDDEKIPTAKATSTPPQKSSPGLIQMLMDFRFKHHFSSTAFGVGPSDSFVVTHPNQLKSKFRGHHKQDSGLVVSPEDDEDSFAEEDDMSLSYSNDPSTREPGQEEQRQEDSSEEEEGILPEERNYLAKLILESEAVAPVPGAKSPEQEEAETTEATAPSVPHRLARPWSSSRLSKMT